VEASQADIEAALAEHQTVLVSLLGEVAQNYLKWRGTQAQLAITRDNLAAQADTLALPRVRFQDGLSNELDVRRAEAQVATTTSQLPVLESQARQARHRLSVLLGQEPGSLLAELASSAPLSPPAPEIAVGLPTDLLQRRPDIRRAERALAAATAHVGVATADLYPRLTLTGMLGLQSLQLSDLLQVASQFWSSGPNIRRSLFDAGRIRANIHAQDACQEQGPGALRDIASIPPQGTPCKGCDRAIPTACSDRQRESTLPCEPNVWAAGMGLAGRSSFGEMMESAQFLS
jgi:multidrug efflux system outer membrane protein